MTQKNAPGFTMIELLIVLAIISILTSVGMVTYSNSLKNARDARRIDDLKNIATYLTFYYKQNGVFPDPAGASCNRTTSGWERGQASDAFINTLFTAGITDRPLPTEKSLTGCTYAYKRCQPNPAAPFYAILYADLETESGEADVRPSVVGGSCWGNEADPGTAQDKKDWAIFLQE